ncbi:crotonase/enoyl-CoA hydratase family protein [Thalassorhabdomicrobium marinisediminis]|uniref:crotonase/enoyl-CoA hydratase family protein n=1 Tax=Thalassorhabdomicrobium marinisediminis TaxID=2170577 RepID=UPI002493CBA9|nr:crotonase/enoyl-CoA hydratase family protein [Thalassorhabdomicrobium marinisediminis]
MFETLTLTTEARGVARLELARSEKHNAMSGQMIEELTQAAARIDADPAIRVVILAAQGRSFCAGGDLGWMQAQMEATAQARAREARKLADMLGAINRLGKPVIARIQGNTFGGGVGLACVCDKVFAVPQATFGLTETKLGLIPATIGPYVLARMGGGAARSVFMSSRPFDAATAQRLGVVSEVVGPQALDDAVNAEAEAYLHCAPAAVAEAKAMALQLGGAPTQETVDASIAALVQRWEHPEATQGIAAFFAKTPPPWRAG